MLSNTAGGPARTTTVYDRLTWRAALILFGTGGHARSLVASLSLTPRCLVGRVPAAWTDVPVVADDSEAVALLEADVSLGWHVAIGDNSLRRRVAETVAARVGWDRFASGASVTAEMHANVLAQWGVAVMSRAYVGPGTAIGRGAILNTAAVVEHDVRVGEWAHISPAAVVLGGAMVEDMAWIGAGAVVMPGVTVGQRAVVGAGSLVRQNVPEDAVVVGVPARPLRPGNA